jgi:hypothetical protein
VNLYQVAYDPVRELHVADVVPFKLETVPEYPLVTMPRSIAPANSVFDGDGVVTDVDVDSAPYPKAFDALTLS